MATLNQITMGATMIELLLPALIGGLGLATLTGPLGSFIVWRRMAYFGDTLAHSALLGVTLGLILNLNLNVMVAVVCMAIAFALVVLQRQKTLPSDTLLGILSHSSLALGLVCISLFSDERINLLSFLLGDLLTLTWSDIAMLGISLVVVLGLLIKFWRPLLLITLDEQLAQVEGISVARYKFLLMALLATVIAFAMKIVGVLLITSLLIIPAATARRFSKSPEQMAVLACLFGYAGVILGILSSFYLDTPVGPAIVVCCFLIFLMVYSFPNSVQNRNWS